MIHLPINLETFSFYKREVENDVSIANKCGRDFLYYVLVYLRPDKFGEGKITPVEIEKQKLFGVPVSKNFAWLQIQFLNTPKYLESLGLTLTINKKKIKNFLDFVVAILFSRLSYDRAIRSIEKHVHNGDVCGIDISIGIFGLLDHVMFVYGFDEENLYVIDSIVAPIEYEKYRTDDKLFMKLSKEIIKKRWTRFGRVWVVDRIDNIH